MIHINDSSINLLKKKTKEMQKRFALRFKPEKLRNLLVKRRLTPRVVEFLEGVYNIANEIFPGRVDMQFGFEITAKTHTNSYGSNHARQFEVFDGYKIIEAYIIIHFPEVTITNSNQQSIDIKDIFVSLPININCHRATVSFRNIYGSRTTFTIAEYKKGYLHSHLMSRDLISLIDDKCKYETFCLGDGDIRYLLSQINVINPINLYNGQKDLIRLTLLQLDTYIRWESLEGRPYIRLNTVINEDYNIPTIPSRTIKSVSNIIIDRLKLYTNTEREASIDWAYENGKFIIIDNERFEDALRVVQDSQTSSMLFKDDAGNYFRSMQDAAIVTHVFDDWLPFQGQKKRFKVEGIGSIRGEIKKYIHPKIKKYVQGKLEFQANRVKVRDSAINRINTNIYP